MTFLPARKLANDDPAMRERRQDARAVIRAVQELLKSPVFVHMIDFSVLAKIAASEQFPARERLHAAEALLAARCKLLDLAVRASGAREVALFDMGLDPDNRGGDVEPKLTINIGVPEVIDVDRLRRRRPVDAVPESPQPPPASPPDGPPGSPPGPLDFGT